MHATLLRIATAQLKLSLHMCFRLIQASTAKKKAVLLYVLSCAGIRNGEGKCWLYLLSLRKANSGRL